MREDEKDTLHTQVAEENKALWDKLHTIRGHIEPLQAEFPHADGYLGQHVAAIIAICENKPEPTPHLQMKYDA